MVTTARTPQASGPHRSVIDSLARELQLPAEEVETVYLEQVRKLEGGARIKTFVSVLAAGSARAQLRRRPRS